MGRLASDCFRAVAIRPGRGFIASRRGCWLPSSPLPMAPRKRKASAGTLGRLSVNWHLPAASAADGARAVAGAASVSQTVGSRVDASSSVCTLAVRSDAPLVLGTSRGSRSGAIGAAVGDASKAAALEAYGRRVHANSVGGTRGSLWRTWEDLHSAWFGSSVDSLPL